MRTHANDVIRPRCLGYWWRGGREATNANAVLLNMLSGIDTGSGSAANGVVA